MILNFKNKKASGHPGGGGGGGGGHSLCEGYYICSAISTPLFQVSGKFVFSAANFLLAGIPLTNALGENLPSRFFNMFNFRLCNAATIRYSLLKFRHMHLCGKG